MGPESFYFSIKTKTDPNNLIVHHNKYIRHIKKSVTIRKTYKDNLNLYFYTTYPSQYTHIT